MQSLYILKQNSASGPFTRDEIQSLLVKGEIHEETLVQQAAGKANMDLSRWKPLRCFPSAPSINIETFHFRNVSHDTNSEKQQITKLWSELKAEQKKHKELSEGENLKLRKEREKLHALELKLKKQIEDLDEARRELEEDRRELEEERSRMEKESGTKNSERNKPKSIKEHAEILRLNGKVTKDEIKKAYKNLARIFHPDALSGQNELLVSLAMEHFKEINNSYDYFRKKYNIK